MLKTLKAFIKSHIIPILLALALIAQTAVYLSVGHQKAYFHMDEAYSFGLSSYDKVEIHDNEDFYDTWHDGAYYADYMQIDDDERWDFRPVYENQVNDVHPPLYYLLLRLTMELTHGRITKWGGIVLNIIIYAFITIFSFLILQKLFTKKSGKHPDLRENIVAVTIAFAASATLAAMIDVAYIRMYALSALNILIVTYLHLRLQESYTKKNLILIALSALVGSLTHYFFLFYLGVLFILTLVSRLRQKQPVKGYVVALVIAAAASLAIFPYSIKHLFFGYRGEGALSNLASLSSLEHLGTFLFILHRYAFNGVLPVLILVLLALFIALKKKGALRKLPSSFLMILLPSLVYFLLVAVASPYMEIRYILPICAPLFLLAFYALYRSLATLLPRTHTASLITLSALALALLMPVFIGDSPAEVTYPSRRPVVTAVEGELKNFPTVYWFNSSNDRFLDDIYLFANLNESYVAKNAELSSSVITDILNDHDLSRGMVLFINDGREDQTHEEVLDAFLKVSGLSSFEHFSRLNACDIYILRP